MAEAATYTLSLTRGTPHDHSASWVAYGIYQGVIEQTTYHWQHPDGQRTAPVLADPGSLQEVGGLVNNRVPICGAQHEGLF